MMDRCAHAEQGSVLFVILILLSVLTVVVLQGMRTMQVHTAGATMYRNGVAAERLALSGIPLAQALLCQDVVADTQEEHGADTLLEDWALSSLPQDMEPAFTSGQIELEIVDEQAKYPVNRLAGEGDKEAVKVVRGIIEAMLRASGMDEDKSFILAQYVTWSLKDWMDRDRTTTIPIEFQGGQAVNVETLPACRNAPLTQPDEILIVLGCLGLPQALTTFLYEGDGNTIPGLRDLLTIIPPSGVNINTAHPLVLQALARDIDKDAALPLARAMDTFRRDPWNKEQLVRSDWYRELAVEGSGFVTFTGTVTTTSWFTLRSTGRVGAITRTACALLHRTQQPQPSQSFADQVALVWVSL